MSPRISRRLFLTQIFLLTACNDFQTIQSNRLTIGVVSYEKGEQLIRQYTNFNNYLSKTTKAFVTLEPTFNEAKAIERINSRAWSLVFATPGIAAIAISQQQYQPLFPLDDADNLRSIIVVPQDSYIDNLKQLNAQKVALGQLGSATGYYFPIFNLYGLTLAELLFAPTPKTVLEWVAQGKVAAGALSEEEFNIYSRQLTEIKFRILYSDPHYIPPGAVLIEPGIEDNFQAQIYKAMHDIPPLTAQEVGYLPNQSVPDYKYMIAVVERVNSIANRILEKPARLYETIPLM